jgi:hypothetical protein
VAIATIAGPSTRTPHGVVARQLRAELRKHGDTWQHVTGRITEIVVIEIIQAAKGPAPTHPPTLLRSFHAELTTRRSGKQVPGFDQQGRVAAKGSRRDCRQGRAFSADSALVGRAELAISPSSGIGSHPTLVTFRDRASRLPCVPEGSICTANSSASDRLGSLNIGRYGGPCRPG